MDAGTISRAHHQLMSEPETDPPVDTEARKAALEIVATLERVKTIAADPPAQAGANTSPSHPALS